jgi:hypothetical protein
MTTKASSLFNALDAGADAPSADVLGGRVRVALANFPDLPTADMSDGDILKICPLPSNARIISIKMSNEDADSSNNDLVYDLGIYDQDGTVRDVDCFVDGGTDLRAAANNTELFPPVDMDGHFGKRVWEQCSNGTSFSEDPRSFLDLCLTFISGTEAGTPDINFTVLYVLD